MLETYLRTVENLGVKIKFLMDGETTFRGAVVVTLLVERSLLIPEVRRLNPVIGKNLFIY